MIPPAPSTKASGNCSEDKAWLTLTFPQGQVAITFTQVLTDYGVVGGRLSGYGDGDFTWSLLGGNSTSYKVGELWTQCGYFADEDVFLLSQDTKASNFFLGAVNITLKNTGNTY